MDNAKTIKDLINVSQLTDEDYIAINQPNVFNPITGENGDTRKTTVKKLAGYVVAKGLSETVDSLPEVVTLADSDVLPLNQQINTVSNAGKVTLKQLTDYTAERAIAEMMYMPTPFLIALNRQHLQIRAGTILKVAVNGIGRFFKADEDVPLDISAILDTGAIAPGKDYYLFLVPDNDTVKFVLSLNKSAPTGYSAISVKLIGGLHTLCVSAGTGMIYQAGDQTLSHPLNGYLAGDILPASVWCLNHRPYSEPEGMVYIDSLDFWCDIYKQSGSGINTKSAYQGAITRSRQYVDFVEDQFCVKKELLSDSEFAAAMLGSNEQTAVAGTNESGATAGGAGGRVDTAGRRMISIYGVEEGCGSLWEWLRTTSAAGVDGTIHGQTAATPSYGYITVTQNSYGPYGQAGGKGSFWGLAAALLAGGAWNDGAYCSSRSRHADHARSSAYSGCGGRGRSRCINASKTI